MIISLRPYGPLPRFRPFVGFLQAFNKNYGRPLARNRGRLQRASAKSVEIPLVADPASV
jgi:hypothetical protein